MDDISTKNEIRLLLEAYLKFIEYRKDSIIGELASSKKLPSNKDIGQRIKNINESFLNDSLIDQKVDILLREQVFLEPAVRKGLPFNLKNVENSSFIDSQDNISINSARCGSYPMKPLKANSYRVTQPHMKVKKPPVSRLKFDHLFSGSQTMDVASPEKDQKQKLKDNIRLMAMKKAQRSSSHKRSIFMPHKLVHGNII